jgi:predicted secreted protein
LDNNAKILHKYLPEDINNISDKAVFFKADIKLTHAILPPADASNNGHYYRVIEKGIYTINGTIKELYVNNLILSNGDLWLTIQDGVLSVAGKFPHPFTGDVILHKDDVGLDQVDNTSDIHKPVSIPTQTELFDRIKTDRIMPIDPLIPESVRLVAGLDSAGKLSMSVMPAAMLGAMEYKGSWDADTNDTDPGAPVVPLPPAITANKGYYYIVSVAGTQVVNIGEPAVKFEVGDWVVSDGDRWDRINNTGAVTSVFGRKGDIFAEAGDYTIEKITNLERLLGDKFSDLNLNEPPIDTINPDYILLEEYVSMVVYKGGINIGTVEPADAEEGDYYIATEAGDYPNLDLLGVEVSDIIVYTSMIWQVQNRGDYYLADSDGDYKAFDPPIGGLEHVKSGDFIVWDGYMWAKQLPSFGGATFEIPLPTGLVVGNPVTYSGNAWKLANSTGSAMTAHGIIMKTSSTTATVITAGEFKWKNHGFDVGNWYYLGTTGSYSKTRTTTGIEQLMLFVLTAEKVTAFVSAPVDTGTDAFSKTYFVNTIAERDLLPNINRKDRCIVLADTDSTMNGEWIVHDDTTDPPTWLPTGSSTGGAIIPEPTTEGSWLRRAKDKAAPGNPPALHYVWSEEIDCGTYN